MCAKRDGPVNPDHVNVQFSVVPSSLSLAWKVPVAPVPLGGTSLKVESLAEKRCGRSSFCACMFTPATKAVASAKATVTAILHPRFFYDLPPERVDFLRTWCPRWSWPFGTRLIDFIAVFVSPCTDH